MAELQKIFLDNERLAFELWITAFPYERSIMRWPEDSATHAWPNWRGTHGWKGKTPGEITRALSSASPDP